MADLVTIQVDDVKVSVPKGTLVVDAAKQTKTVDIPVFCYHPKLPPVGMCRMCLVEIGTPKMDPATKQPVRDEQGEYVIAWMPKLQTACTMPVSEGMAIRTQSTQVKSAQKEVLEFLLTSHPLDCPICQKGGECPLQNLTLRHGPGSSRFVYEDKQHLDKHKPLGDLIFLDEERCIQCSRCIRFQDEIADDHVLGFDQRGRQLQITTFSEPGFDSKFSGNTTDICPVGALLTADFHHSARPWELRSVPSLCTHCAVGCNTALDTRRNQGHIERVMPRQNEQVNEIWICDKGRFGYHYASPSPARLTSPLVRRNGKLEKATWDQALRVVADKLSTAGTAAGGLAGDRLSNEDLFAFQELFRQGLHSANVDQWPHSMGGAEIVAQVGLGQGSAMHTWGANTAVLVIASDLEEEAPVWWLRLHAAARRGARVVVAHGRKTKTERRATHVLHYRYGQAVQTLNALLRAVLEQGLDNNNKVTLAGAEGGEALRAAVLRTPAPDGLAASDLAAAAKTLAQAENLVIMYGGEGQSLAGSRALAQAAANFLIATNHVGRANNGLLPVWPHNNTQGAWDMGVRPDLLPGYRAAHTPGKGAAEMLSGGVRALFIAGADPAGDDARIAATLRKSIEFLVVSELFLTKTAEMADVVLPAQAFAEREGTFTNGERRVQRFYAALQPSPDTWADWKIITHIGQRVGLAAAPASAALIMTRITKAVPQYMNMTYATLAQTEEQFPDVGGRDSYYGGAAHQNTSGTGRVWPTTAEMGDARLRVTYTEDDAPAGSGLLIVPITLLYDGGTTLQPSTQALLETHIPAAYVELNRADAQTLGIADGDAVTLTLHDLSLPVRAHVNGKAPAGVALLPRGLAGVGDVRAPGYGAVRKG